jgi:hypothetical protein
VLTGLVIALVAAPGWAALARPIASYEMNEPRSANRLLDSSRNGLNGRIGRDVQPGVRFQGARGHQFPRIADGVENARHIDRVSHRAALNPGKSRFTVVIRFRTSQPKGNIVQKGQSGAKGGYFNFEMLDGKPRCIFRDSEGKKRTGFGTEDLSDGEWHTVGCVRTSKAVTMFVDGDRAGRRVGRLGKIANNWPLTIGGKYRCNPPKVGCDYFVGLVDFVRIRKG